MVDFQSRTSRHEDEADEEAEEEVQSEADESESETDAVEQQSRPADSLDRDELRYAVLTIARNRTISEDAQGDIVVEAIETEGGVVTTRELVQPEIDVVQSTVRKLTKQSDVDVIVTIGGTGVEPDDITIEALEPLFDKELPGFGELFRLLAHESQGSAVVGTRTTAGLVARVPVFAVPGTTNGALLATDEIILPEAASLAVAARSTWFDDEGPAAN